MNPSVFVMYGRQDEALAQRLVDGLNHHGVDTWWYREDAEPGNEQLVEIIRNIRRCDIAVLCCTRHAFTRPGVTYEIIITAGQSGLQRAGARSLIPAVFDDVLDSDATPEWLTCDQARSAHVIVSGLVAVDFRQAMHDDAKWDEQLLKLISALRNFDCAAGSTNPRSPDCEKPALTMPGQLTPLTTHLALAIAVLVVPAWSRLKAYYRNALPDAPDDGYGVAEATFAMAGFVGLESVGTVVWMLMGYALGSVTFASFGPRLRFFRVAVLMMVSLLILSFVLPPYRLLEIMLVLFGGGSPYDIPGSEPFLARCVDKPFFEGIMTVQPLAWVIVVLASPLSPLLVRRSRWWPDRSLFRFPS